MKTLIALFLAAGMINAATAQSMVAPAGPDKEPEYIQVDTIETALRVGIRIAMHNMERFGSQTSWGNFCAHEDESITVSAHKPGEASYATVAKVGDVYQVRAGGYPKKPAVECYSLDDKEMIVASKFERRSD